MKRSAVLGACAALVVVALFVGAATVPPAAISIDYPFEGSIFPPDSQIQDALNIDQTSNSDNINTKLGQDCFGVPPPPNSKLRVAGSEY